MIWVILLVAVCAFFAGLIAGLTIGEQD